MSKIHILLRTAEQKNKNNKNKPEWINNKNCIRNIWDTRQEAEFIIFGDRLEKESQGFVKAHCDKFIEIKKHGNAESFLEVYEYALKHYKDDDIIYFVEDDYIHKPSWEKIMLEGFTRAEYISLYDHPDKYGNQLDFLFITESTHWKFTHSTTMTYATTGRCLREDYDIVKRFVTTGIPQDHAMFLELKAMGRRLATPIPGFSTHGETQFLSPIIKWEEYV